VGKTGKDLKGHGRVAVTKQKKKQDEAEDVGDSFGWNADVWRFTHLPSRQNQTQSMARAVLPKDGPLSWAAYATRILSPGADPAH
jgi:hypothetical protein